MPTSISSNDQIIINRILTAVAEYNASDLHLSVGNPPMLRVDNELTALREEQVVTPDFIEKFAQFFLSEDKKKTLVEEKEIVFSFDFQNRIRFKVHFFYQDGYISASLRFIPQQIRSREELGLPKQTERFTKLNKGLVIVTGPFNSGRSSTMATFINEINNFRSEHILTIEKPTEYVFIDNKSVIEQREVGRDTISCQRALKSAMRADVDVVMISEIKGDAVIREALDLAEAGRLVFGSMSCDSAVKTVEKIIESFGADEQKKVRSQLSQVLEGVVVQRLLPRVGGGRILVAEILVPTQAARSIIREGNIYQLANILQTSREEGMLSLDRSLSELVKTGEILLEDAQEHAVDKNQLKMMARG